MNIYIYISIFFVFCFSNCFGEGIDSQNRLLLKILDTNSNWDIIEKTSDSIYISIKKVKETKLNAIKVEKIYNIPPRFFTEVIMNVGDYNSFLSNSKSLYSKVIKNTKNGLIGYQQIKVNLPFFYNREYYFYMGREPLDNLSPNMMCYWILLNPNQDKKNFNRSDNTIYLKKGAGLWKWEANKSGGVKIAYILTMHPGGSIPDFMIEIINKNSIVGLFRDVERKVNSNNAFSG
tara:strand:- start:117 stop:815 length:699 start_codon:yes stop_codon:yes gene_type:complete